MTNHKTTVYPLEFEGYYFACECRVVSHGFESLTEAKAAAFTHEWAQRTLETKGVNQPPVTEVEKLTKMMEQVSVQMEYLTTTYKELQDKMIALLEASN